VRIVAAVAAIAAIGVTSAPQPAACAKAPDGATLFYVESVAGAPGDTLVTARLCMASTPALGSYTAALNYDSTEMRLVRVQTSGGMQVVNPRTAGVIRIAGAAPEGFRNGVLATMAFKPSRRGLGSLKVSVSEATSTKGASLASGLRVTGWVAK
jgi:hypothetical protein